MTQRSNAALSNAYKPPSAFEMSVLSFKLLSEYWMTVGASERRPRALESLNLLDKLL